MRSSRRASRISEADRCRVRARSGGTEVILSAFHMLRFSYDMHSGPDHLTSERSQMSTVMPEPSFLATRRGKLTLALLCAVAFLDFVDASIVNVALPSIRRALHFSVQRLVWLPSGHLLTYGGSLLPGGRAADHPGRRRAPIAPVGAIA